MKSLFNTLQSAAKPTHSPNYSEATPKAGIARVVDSFSTAAIKAKLHGPADAQRATFRAPGTKARAAICKVPLPQLPRPMSNALGTMPASVVTAAQRDAIAGDAISQMNRGVDGESVRERIWTNIVGRSAAFSPAVRQANADVDAQMQHFRSHAQTLLPDMAARDIERAASNVWPMLCFQVLAGKKPELTETMVGFSLLYPLTDDLLDAPGFPKEAKKDFLKRFGRLVSHGDTAPNGTPHEDQVWSMFHRIDGEWSRQQFPVTYRLMLELLHSQVKSQLQLGGVPHDKPVPRDVDVWNVTVEKGALQILCDAYLANGHVSHNEASFAAHFGSLIQFINDMRTVEEDLADGQYTPFNLPHARGEQLDHVVGHVLSHFASTFDCDDHARTARANETTRGFMKLVQARLTYEFLMGLSRNLDKLSPAFKARVDAQSPVPLDILAQL